MNIYLDDFDIQASGKVTAFAKGSYNFDPVVAYDADEYVSHVLTALCAMFNGNNDPERKPIDLQKVLPRMKIADVTLSSGEVIPALYINHDLQNWIRGVIDDYLSNLKRVIVEAESRVLINTKELFDAWFGETPTTLDFTGDIFYAYVGKHAFEKQVLAFEEAPHGWKLPDAIPVFMQVVGVSKDSIRLQPCGRITRILPLSTEYPKDILAQMCISNQLCLFASGKSGVDEVIKSFKNIQ